MARLSFKKQYVGPILEGVKVQTVRRHFAGEPGDVIDATCIWGQPPFARLRVIAVDRIALDDLTEEDAHRDGFFCAEELKETIRSYYGDVRAVARVRFEVIGT